MGKKQHSKDLMYITHSEWATQYGGFKKDKTIKKQYLPFNYCALSLQPFEDPVCLEDGTLFEITNIIPYIQKFKRNPVTGTPLSVSDLIRVYFTKNADGDYICPMTFKVFTEHSHIVAIRTSGKVYSYEAVEQFNIKAKNWMDLLTNEPFTRKDIIHLQDPGKERRRAINDFEYLKNESLRMEKEVEEDVNPSESAARVFKQMEEKGIRPTKKEKSASAEATMTKEMQLRKMLKKEEESVKDAKRKLEALANTSSSKPFYAELESERDEGRVAPSFTSSVAKPSFQHKREKMTEEDFLSSLFERVRRRRKKAFVSLVTSAGPINLQLHADITPRAVYNFLELCKKGYYNGTIFHRLIEGFMVQGGDPTGTGRGGQSVWGKPFRDEFDSRLSHDDRGILRINRCTDELIFDAAWQTAGGTPTDLKHAVFGKIVGGFETLAKIEKFETNAKDRPLEDIVFRQCNVFENPFADEVEIWKKEQEDEAKKAVLEAEKKEQRLRRLLDNETTTTLSAASGTDVGRYIKASDDSGVQKGEGSKKKRKITAGFGNFEGW